MYDYCTFTLYRIMRRTTKVIRGRVPGKSYHVQKLLLRREIQYKVSIETTRLITKDYVRVL